MEIQTDTTGEFARVKLVGELRREDADTFTEDVYSLVAEQNAKVAIDLSALSMIDSAGLSALMNLVTRARLSDADVVLVNPSAFVKGVFEVTRLDTWFDILPDMAAAEQRLMA